MRIDKWLWAARFFKTRALASKACDLGRIGAGEATAKASREVRLGDMLRIRNEGGDYVVEVLALSEMRGPSATAQELYRETEPSREARLKTIEDRKAMLQFGGATEGRPGKKDRRKMEGFHRNPY